MFTFKIFRAKSGNRENVSFGAQLDARSEFGSFESRFEPLETLSFRLALFPASETALVRRYGRIGALGGSYLPTPSQTNFNNHNRENLYVEKQSHRPAPVRLFWVGNAILREISH